MRQLSITRKFWTVSLFDGRAKIGWNGGWSGNGMDGNLDGGESHPMDGWKQGDWDGLMIVDVFCGEVLKLKLRMRARSYAIY